MLYSLFYIALHFLLLLHLTGPICFIWIKKINSVDEGNRMTIIELLQNIKLWCIYLHVYLMCGS